MQLVIPINEFDINNVYFNHPIPNNVLDGSLFSRVLYSDEYITFNGIYLGINWRINQDSFISFRDSDNKSDDIDHNEVDKNQLDLLTEEQDINTLINIEEKILNKLNLKNKHKVLQVQEQIFNNFKKKNQNIEHLELNHTYIFKCSGIWISDDTYGLTFKIIDNNFNHQ